MSLEVNISEPDEFNCVELHSAIENVAKIMKFTDFGYHVDYLNGSGYIANIFRVILTENGSDKNVSVIVKTLINTARKELFRELHNREVKAYTHVINTYKTLQNEIDESKRLILPKCVYSSNEKGNEVLIFEDLLVNGFEVNVSLAKNNKLEFSQVSLIFSELAKFHGLSYVFERNNRNYYDEMTEEFTDLLFQYSFLDKSKLRDYFTDSFEKSLHVITNMEVRAKLETIQPKLLHLFQNYVKTNKTNVFCHGDFWINNILFREMNDTMDLCFLDFQTLRYTNPVTDLIYFLYICTDSHFRSEYIDQLIHIYYNSLKTYLSLFNVGSDNIYTYEELTNDVDQYKVLGLLVALVEMRIIVAESERYLSRDTKAVSEIDLVNIPEEEKNKLFSEANDNLFKARINDVVTESAENGVLDRLLEVALTIT